MSANTLLPAGQWAQDEFGLAELGDLRLNNLLLQVDGKLAANPGGTLPQVSRNGGKSYGRGPGASTRTTIVELRTVRVDLDGP